MFVPVFYSGVTNDVQQEIIAINLDEILFINGTQHLSLNGLMRVKKLPEMRGPNCKACFKVCQKKISKNPVPLI